MGKMGEPQRTCIGCRQIRPKNEMIRIVRRPDRSVGVDDTGSEPGRGAYVCDERCAEVARPRMARALKASGVDGSMIEKAAAEAASHRRER